MGRLFSLPDKEEVPGSNPGAPTSDLQGFLPLTPPLRPPAAILLQPKCLRWDDSSWGSLALVVTGVAAPQSPNACIHCRLGVHRHHTRLLRGAALHTGGCDSSNVPLRPPQSGGEPLVRPARGSVFVLRGADPTGARKSTKRTACSTTGRRDATASEALRTAHRRVPAWEERITMPRRERRPSSRRKADT